MKIIVFSRSARAAQRAGNHARRPTNHVRAEKRDRFRFARQSPSVARTVPHLDQSSLAQIRQAASDNHRIGVHALGDLIRGSMILTRSAKVSTVVEEITLGVDGTSNRLAVDTRTMLLQVLRGSGRDRRSLPPAAKQKLAEGGRWRLARVRRPTRMKTIVTTLLNSHRSNDDQYHIGRVRLRRGGRG
jgi:hypothetical protein